MNQNAVPISHEKNHFREMFEAFRWALLRYSSPRTFRLTGLLIGLLAMVTGLYASKILVASYLFQVITENAGREQIMLHLGGFLLLYMLENYLSYAASITQVRLFNDGYHSIRVGVAQDIALRSPSEILSQKPLNPSNIFRFRSNVMRVRDELSFMLVNNVIAIIVSISVLGVKMLIPALMMSVFVIISLWWMSRANRKTVQQGLTNEVKYHAIDSYLDDRMRNPQLMVLSGNTNRDLDRLSHMINDAGDYNLSMWRRFERHSQARQHMGTLFVGLVVAYVIYQYTLGQADFAMIPFVLTSAIEVFNKTWRLANSDRVLNKVAPNIIKTVQALRKPSLAPDPREGQSIADSLAEKVSIEFRNVSFGYTDDSGQQKTVLKDVSFTINDGDRVALVGPTGAGKSTITRLLTGEVVPTSGEILINGIPMHDISLDSLRRMLGICMQSPRPYGGTIRDGASYFLHGDNPNHDRIEELIDRCHLREIIRTEEGIFQEVLKDGNDLSGGQTQRYMILSLLMADERPLFILDEPTSSLDPLTERTINSLIDESKARVLLVIAHRLSTVEGANKFIELVPTPSGSVAKVHAGLQMAKQESAFVAQSAALQAV